MRRLAVPYLVVQAAAVPAWWLAMAAWPSVRGRFELDPGNPDVLDAFLLGDLVLLAAGSAVAAAVLGRNRVVGAVVAGGWAASTLTLAGWVLAGGHGWLGLPPMIVGTALTAWSVGTAR
jgi:hypothetical protein